MDDLAAILADLFTGERLVRIELTRPRDGGEGAPRSVTVRPVTVRGERRYQFEERRERKAMHRNLDAEAAKPEVTRLMRETYRTVRIQATDEDLTLTADAGGGVRIARRSAARPAADVAHDRAKQHILPEGRPVDFLVRLGVMTADGRVIGTRRDKFRQVNRFLEMVADVAPELDHLGPATAVDFGCGRAYLTFALHHYLTNVRGLPVDIVGVDARADLVEQCRHVAADLELQGLRFERSTIANYRGIERADMVVALHACDTATDEALARAVQWRSRVVMAAPCCQHELRTQLRSEPLAPMLGHGIIRERLVALVTDTARSMLLEAAGYRVQLVEFVETEHTPKNILLRGILRTDAAAQRAADSARAKYEAFRDFWRIEPALEQMLDNPCQPAAPPAGR